MSRDNLSDCDLVTLGWDEAGDGRAMCSQQGDRRRQIGSPVPEHLEAVLSTIAKRSWNAAFGTA